MACLCFRPSRASFEPEEAPQIVLRPDATLLADVPDAAPAPASHSRLAAKGVAEQLSSDTRGTGRDTAPADARRPAEEDDTPMSIWEKLAAQEICSIGQEQLPAGEEPLAIVRRDSPAAATALAAVPPLPVPAAQPGAAAATPARQASSGGGSTKASPSPAARKPWGARASPAGQAPAALPATPRRSSSGARAGSEGVSPSVLRPTASSAARTHATCKPKSDELLWRH